MSKFSRIKTYLASLAVTMAICVVGVSVAEFQMTRQAFLLALIISIIVLFNIVLRIVFKKNNTTAYSRVNLLTEEISQLYKCIDSTIINDLTIVRAEFAQIKQVANDASHQLASNFYDLVDNIASQQKLIETLMCSTDYRDNEHTRAKISEISEKTKEMIFFTIQLLQFEDIISQVSDNGIQYINNIESFLSYINELLKDNIHNHLLENNFNSLDKTITLITDITLLIQKKHALPSRKAAHQLDMSEGGIELF